MKTSNGVPVRIQKVGEANQTCDHSVAEGESIPMSPGKPYSNPKFAGRAAVEPKVEIKEMEPGVFEITVTCRCGERAVVRCESLLADSVKKS